MTTPDFWVKTDPELNCRDPKLLEILDYWRRKRGDRAMPARRDIDPLDLRSQLGNLVLVDVEHQPLRLKYRLIGTKITQAMRRDFTGRYYDEVYPPELLESINDSFRWMFAHRLPLRSHGEAFYPDKNYYEYEALNMPLSEDGETINMVLGGLVFQLKSKQSG
ncbi:MAG: PAS domain-containing protein [Alphaproteobacteria bacterium]|jgi:hypothetical protein|nr:PAS domain-containing protein [Alphaproteobacteria bacterium]MDP6567947.1 PAS domain-containing protein [Alphaproteobacteria bacterium]MDP6812357.1 PAS domain-containing protein [Alphaproteobacteria bacterium]